jgi:hypothetical protein
MGPEMCFRRRVVGATVRLAPCLAMIVVLVVAAGCVEAGPSQFVIISDTQNIDGVDKMVREIIDLHPPFVIGVGDMPSLFGPPDAWRRLREAGIEVHNAMGNHDGGVKHQLRYGLPPWQSTSVIDQIQRFAVDNKFYYSFNHWGIHFCIVDTCTDDVNAEIEWLEDDLGRHVNNPSRFPTLVFFHYPEWLAKEEGRGPGPIHRVLEKYKGTHTVKAAFNGHTHMGRNVPLEATLGVPQYWLFPSAPFGASVHTEYVVATVEPDQVSFERRIIFDAGMADVFTIHPITGRFAPTAQ